ncbi:MAG: glycosyltransferase [Candidatus Omnitrophota bacterium]
MRITTKKFRKMYYSVKRNLKRDVFKKASGDLTFGICIFNRFTISDKKLQVMGDELQARAIAREVMEHCPQIKQCRIYDIKEAGKIKDDIIFNMWAEYPAVKKRSNSQKTVMWLQNAGFKDRAKEFVDSYDYVFSPSKKICEEFDGFNYLPMACEDTEIFRKAAPEEQLKTEVCFVGNYNEYQRPLHLQEQFILPAAKYNFGLWGSNWDMSPFASIRDSARGRLEPHDIPKAYSSADIVLSNHWLAHRDEEMVTTRIFEALACEAFVISDYFGALDEFKDYIVFTSGGKDLEDKIADYAANPQKRAQKTRGAREFILKNHTFKNRVKTIAGAIGLTFNSKEALT